MICHKNQKNKKQKTNKNKRKTQEKNKVAAHLPLLFV